jgi:hypothetical protein
MVQHYYRALLATAYNAQRSKLLLCRYGHTVFIATCERYSATVVIHVYQIL